MWWNRAEAGRPVVRIFGKLESGESFLVRETRRRPRFWIRASDAASARERGAPVRESDLRVWTGEAAAEIELTLPSDVPALRDALHDTGIPTFEADVRFAYRPLIDAGIRGSLSIEGTSRPGPSAGDATKPGTTS